MASKRPRKPGPKSPVSSRPDVPAASASTAAPRFSVVGIGGSAGGIEAFTHLLKELPENTGMAFVFILHMGHEQKSILPEILARSTEMPVSEVDREVKVEPNRVYTISPGTDLALKDGTLVPSRHGHEKGAKRSVDHFFASLAAERGHQAIGVVLSGSASDGALGLQQIKSEGGITFAQDGTAQHDSMPSHAIATDCVDFVLPPEEIAAEIARVARHPLLAVGAGEPVEVLPAVDTAVVIEALRAATGVDFSHYKRNTLHRRISRRMVLQRIEKPRDYVDFLKRTPGELEALYQDVLIGVTSFFRDPETFDSLKSDVFPRLVEERARSETVRMWALGCSTGEEAYSLAIAFSEFAEAARRPFPLQVFATDLNNKGIDTARAGYYPRRILEDVGNERIRRYFVEVDGGYRVRKSIRDACVFARHNILTEPPFSRIDLISCRNLLIYLGPEMQQRVIPMLHYALRPNGHLLLGKSETIGTFRDLFDLADARHKIYRKKPVPARLTVAGITSHIRPQRAGIAEGQKRAMAEGPAPNLLDIQKEAERLILMRYAPTSVLVNADFDILQFRGNTGAYLAPAPGRASLNLIKMLREGLLVPVRNLLSKARKDGMPARKNGLSFRSNGGYRDVAIEVIPLRGAAHGSPNYLVLFEETEPADRKARLKREEAEAAADEDEQQNLKQELSATREYLQSVIEQQEAVNEELQSANEEIQSSNEELQSINEELETSKEEVQSSNEELSTVNEELNHRNAELSQTNNDLINLLASVQMAIVMVGADLRIRRLTPAAEKMLNLIPADVGRPVRDLNLNISLPDLARHLEEVIDTVTAREFEVLDKQDRWHLLRLRPYRTVDNVIDGAVITLIDIDSVRRDQEKLRHQAELLDQAYEPILMWEIGGRIIYWSKAAEELYGYSKAEALSRGKYDLLGTGQSEAEINEKLEKTGRWSGDLMHTTRDGTSIRVSSRMSLVREADGRRLVVETIHPLDADARA